ncbi:MAG: hypothetical protein Kapaf2KO_19470 [Candidatus Kapaibacteriales bacterium]
MNRHLYISDMILKKLYFLSLVVAVFLFFVVNGNSQSRMPEVKPAAEPVLKNEPFNLPNTIIYGTQENKVASLEKRLPELEYRLADNILDSINTLAKQTPTLLPMPPLPNQIPKTDGRNGYLEGGFGSFATLGAEAGAGFSIGRFDMYLDGSAELSNGHLDDAEYSKFFARLESDYVAEDKFWIFGGSETRTTVTAMNNNYRNFAADSAQGISNLGFSARLDTDGSYEGYLFDIDGGIRSISYISDMPDGTDLGIDALVNVVGTGDLANFGVEGEIDLSNFATGGYSRINAGLLWNFFNRYFNLDANAGVTLATPTEGGTFLWPEVNAELNIPLGRVFTLRANGETGIENNTFTDMLVLNPYISAESEVLYTTNLFSASAYLMHHPATKFGFMLGGGYNAYNDYQFFTDSQNSLFAASYADATIAFAEFEGFWDINESNALTGNIRYNITSLDSIDTEIPYIPAFQTEFGYRVTFFDFLQLKPSISYIGTRYSDIMNTEEIKGYIDVRLYADAEIWDGFLAKIEAHNLLNSDIFVWNGYRARGVFFTGGLIWRF